MKDEVLKFFVIRNALVTHTRCDAELNTAYTKRRDGAARQERHRKLLKDKEPVTRPSRVSNAQEDRTGKDKTVEERKEGKKELSGVNGKDAAFEARTRRPRDHEQRPTRSGRCTSLMQA